MKYIDRKAELRIPCKRNDNRAVEGWIRGPARAVEQIKRGNGGVKLRGTQKSVEDKGECGGSYKGGPRCGECMAKERKEAGGRFRDRPKERSVAGRGRSVVLRVQ